MCELKAGDLWTCHLDGSETSECHSCLQGQQSLARAPWKYPWQTEGTWHGQLGQKNAMLSRTTGSMGKDTRSQCEGVGILNLRQVQFFHSIRWARTSPENTYWKDEELGISTLSPISLCPLTVLNYVVSYQLALLRDMGKDASSSSPE